MDSNIPYGFSLEGNPLHDTNHNSRRMLTVGEAQAMQEREQKKAREEFELRYSTPRSPDEFHDWKRKQRLRTESEIDRANEIISEMKATNPGQFE